MKLLLVLNTVPYPVRVGGIQAVYNIVDGLRKHVEIALVVCIDKDKKADCESLKKIWSDITFFEFVKTRGIKHYLMRLLQNKLQDYTFGDKRLRGLRMPIAYYEPKWLDFIKNSVITFNPDIIQTEFYINEDLGYIFPARIKKIFVQHEIHYVVNNMWIEKCHFEQSNILKAYYNKLKADEIAAMNQFNAILTLNDVDRKTLIQDGVTSEIYTSPVCVIPAIKRNDCVFSNKLVFIGTGGHPPNVEGLIWFVQEIWPKVVEKYPLVQLHIVGKWTEGQKTQFENYKNIFFDGFVNSLQGTLKGAICIVPILRGSGIRMKILDAVNFGSPFISTTIGALGMGFDDGRDCFIADTPNDFYCKLSALIEDSNLRETFYKNSYIVYNNLYTKEAVVNHRLAIYKQILNS